MAFENFWGKNETTSPLRKISSPEMTSRIYKYSFMFSVKKIINK